MKWYHKRLAIYYLILLFNIRCSAFLNLYEPETVVVQRSIRHNSSPQGTYSLVNETGIKKGVGEDALIENHVHVRLEAGKGV